MTKLGLIMHKNKLMKCRSTLHNFTKNIFYVFPLSRYFSLPVFFPVFLYKIMTNGCSQHTSFKAKETNYADKGRRVKYIRQLQEHTRHVVLKKYVSK